MRRTAALSRCTGAVSALLLFTTVAHAGADEKIAAEALFDEGKRLMTEGKFGPACDKLEQSERVDAAVGTLLYLAECYEKSGRPASAWATFREASSQARAEGQLERARVGQERALRLEPLLVKLTINVAPEDTAIPGFAVKRANDAVPQALWGASVPVDPGDYTIEASAPGYDTFTSRVVVGKESSSFDVPALHQQPAAVAVTPTAPATAASAPAYVAPTGATAPGADSGGGLGGGQIAGLVIAGAGVVSLAVGTVFGVNAISKNDDAKKHCPRGNACDDQTGVSLSKDANTDATIANVTVGLGAAALVGGGLLYFLSPSKHTAEAAFHVVPAFSACEVGAFAEGRF
jgi:hypothetical protein